MACTHGLTIFFFIEHLYPGLPTRLGALQMRGPARNIAQTYKNNIYTKHDISCAPTPSKRKLTSQKGQNSGTISQLGDYNISDYIPQAHTMYQGPIVLLSNSLVTL